MRVAPTLATVVIGAVSGVLSGAFGIGGGMLTTPAIRLVLGAPAPIAVGTPLPVIVPGALTGAVAYLRRGLADLRVGVTVGAVGAVATVVGAALAHRIGGRATLIATAVVIGIAAIDIARPSSARDVATGTASPQEQGAMRARYGVAGLLVLGVLAGSFSGLLGLGGGFIVVPGLVRLARFEIKRAIGTSLVVVSMLAIPGTFAHAALGHVDWSIAAGLALGVVPGALVGARLTVIAQERIVRVAFAVALLAAGITLGVTEVLAR